MGFHLIIIKFQSLISIFHNSHQSTPFRVTSNFNSFFTIFNFID
jgi:hypothetical protein